MSPAARPSKRLAGWRPLCRAAKRARGRRAREAALVARPRLVSMADTVARLNARFAQGHPTSNISAAGLVVHQFDGVGLVQLLQETAIRNRLPIERTGNVTTAVPWLPCPEGSWCSKFADRFSASVVNRRLPHMLSGSAPGVILAPATASRALLCAWANDAHSMTEELTCMPPDAVWKGRDVGRWPFESSANCTPGCYRPPTAQELARNTTTPPRKVKWCRSGSGAWCPWRPGSLSDMLEQSERQNRERQKHSRWATSCNQQGGCRYNELVLAAEQWVHGLPGSIEAFFVPKGSPHVEPTRILHSQFLRQFELAVDPPLLLEMDLAHLDAPLRKWLPASDSEAFVPHGP